MEDIEAFFQVLRFLVFSIFKPMLIVFDVALIIAFFWALPHALKYRPHFVYNPRDPRHLKKKNAHGAQASPSTGITKGQIEERWKGVRAALAQGTREGMRSAILEADSIVDNILKDAGVGGQTMADRLEKLSAKKFTSQKGLWQAHRVRNEVAHAPDFELSLAMAQRAIGQYEAFLKELNLL